MSALLALAERCEKATGPDRELDAELAVAVTHDFRIPRASDHCEAGTYWREHRHGMTLQTAPDYTASLDAAMTLVPAGYYPLLDTWFDRKSAVLRHETRRPYIEGLGDTLALSLCAAALRARAASAIETQRATTEGRGPQDESAASEAGDAQ